MVEDVLVPDATNQTTNIRCVLILVVVEDVLVHENGNEEKANNISLNPCCGGRCSSTLYGY